jgi:hypothetical protein
MIISLLPTPLPRLQQHNLKHQILVQAMYKNVIIFMVCILFHLYGFHLQRLECESIVQFIFLNGI